MGGQERMLDQRAPVKFLEFSFTAVFVAGVVDPGPAFSECADCCIVKAQGFAFSGEWPIEPRKEAGYREATVPDPSTFWRHC